MNFGRFLLAMLFSLSPLTVAAEPVTSTEAGFDGPVPGFNVSLGAMTAVATYHELVYKTPTTDDLLSRLDWPLPVNLGVYSDLGWNLLPGLETHLRLATTWSQWGATMTDWDWLIGSSAGPPEKSSTSTAYLTGFQSVAWSVGWAFLQENHLTLTAGLAIEYRHLAWEAYSAATSYAGNYVGLIADYWQSWLLPAVALQGQLDFRPWCLQAGLEASPWSMSWDRDLHVLRQTTFQDSTAGGPAVKPQLQISYDLSSGDRLELGASYQVAFGNRGDTTQINSGNATSTAAAGTYKMSGGMGLESLNLWLGVRHGL